MPEHGGALAPILWQRLDLPGHDAAWLRLSPEGAELSGMAVFTEDAPTALAYSVRCDPAWRTLEGRVRGWRGPAAVDLQVRREREGRWIMNGVPCPGVGGCEDLDLNFTPATNLFPLRRLALADGESAEVRSAWLEWPEGRLRSLVQRYRRVGASSYDYEADLPDGTTFRAVLRVGPEGWVREYGDLWREEDSR